MGKPQTPHRSSDKKCLMDDDAVRQARAKWETGEYKTLQKLADEYGVKVAYMKGVVNYTLRTTVR